MTTHDAAIRRHNGTASNDPDAVGTGFCPHGSYNASAILFDNLAAGRSDRIAVLSPAGDFTYAELAGLAGRIGNALLALGLRRGERVLLLLDDTGIYPAAFFGA